MKKLILSVSGGVDSMLLMEMAYRSFGPFESIDPKNCFVITFDHGTRHGQSRLDADFVLREAKKRQLPAKKIKIKIPRNSDTGFEDAARRLRYKYLRKWKRKLKAGYIVLAHHEDDLIETILMKIIRGTFIKGLIGMEERSQDLWRPLLNLKKSDIYELARKFNIDWKEDKTNLDISNPRNRLRNILIPSIEEAIPRIRNNIHILRTSALLTRECLDNKTSPLLELLKTEGLDYSIWQDLNTIEKYYLISSIEVWEDDSNILQTKKLEDLIRRLDTLQSGKKVLLAHTKYPIIRKVDKLYFYEN